MVATIDSMDVGQDLSGATSVHFAELHYSPAAMEQAEDRPYKPGITQGLMINYYVVQASIDEAMEALLLPKFRTQEKIAKGENAASMAEAFKGPEEDEDEIMARLCGHLSSGAEDWDWMHERD